MDLKDHILARILDKPMETEFSRQDRATLAIVNDRIHAHKTLRINYTTYDVRRDQDTINPRTNSDVMILSQEDDEDSDGHPYWYARILGLFHVDVIHTGTNSKNHSVQRFEFAWVRWMGTDPDNPGGWESKRLRQVGFVDGEGGFGFIDPQQIIRAVHLIPAFHYGKTTSLLGPSAVRQKEFFNAWVPRWPIGDENRDPDSEDDLDYEDELDIDEEFQGVEGKRRLEELFDNDRDWVCYYVNM
jgi:hypothetical protein